MEDAMLANVPPSGGDTRNRVLLEPMTVEHLPRLSELMTESAEFHRPWVSYPHTVDRLLGYLEQSTAARDLLFVVILRESGDIVGMMNLSRITLGAWLTCECGCVVAKRYRGYGYLTEAMGLLVRYAFDELRLGRVEALVGERNIASQRMLRKVGFRPEGVARSVLRIGGKPMDQVRWAIVTEDVTTRDPKSEGGEQ